MSGDDSEISIEQVEAMRQGHLGRWLASRNLGGEPDLEWSYPAFAARSLLLAPAVGDPGRQYFFESVHDFDDLMRVLHINFLLGEAGAADDAMYTVTVGFNTFDSIFYLSDGRLELPDAREPWRGRHLVLVTGWADDRATLLFRNSWGERWGDHGYGYMSRAYFEAHADSATVSSFAHIGLTEENFAIAPDPNNEAWLRAWLEPRERVEEALDIRETRHDLVTYRMVSFDWGCPVDVIEIWAAGRRWAWVHLFHPSGYDDRRSVIREFFVAPSARRRGIGSALESVAVSFARAEGSKRLLIEVQEADGTEEAISRACAFIGSRGYTRERPSEQLRPILVGRASKII